MSSWNRGSSAFGSSGKFFGGASSGQRGGQARTPYGSRAQSPAQNITIQAAPPRRFIPRGQQRAPAKTDEEKLAFIKNTTRELFLRGFTLCVLPGNIPLCYATGDCLVTEYGIWNDYIKKDCKPYAEKIAQWGQPQENEAPFTWGLRPIEPRFLSPLSEPSTIQWVWTFVVTNISPYQAAREVLKAGLLAVNFNIEGASNKEVVNVIMNYVNAGDVPADKTIKACLINALGFKKGVAPGDLSKDYAEEQPVFANLKLLQQAEVMNETISKLNRKIQTARTDNGLPPQPQATPGRQPLTAFQTPQQDFLSDEEVVEQQTIMTNA